MKFSAIFAVVAAATVVNAQGYNSTTSATITSTTASIYDSRTVDVPAPSSTPATAITSIYTIVSSCGSVQIYLPSTKIIPLNSTARSATYTGTGSTGGAVAAIQTQAAALAGGLMAAALLL